ncbi:VOC family protein [Haliovirga abyssi]|uniref:Glyoxalase n=1 Tax=Haliovirga abyssi TaxID=2996794 RepID=A0AAU9DWY8_9FUSO|nr:VOC family protein [Haliovirga abyssi]BDU49820.1 glyoxalase [Haliovirga abyssi]
MNIEHIAIWTNDIERLRSFYIKYFNAKSNKKYYNPKKKFESYFLTFSSGARLEIMQTTNIQEKPNDINIKYTGLIHMAFSVGSEDLVIKLTDKLSKDGYEVISEPRKTGDGYFESCILDPDKNEIEITE